MRLYNAFAKPIAYVIQDRYNAFAKPIAYVIQDRYNAFAKPIAYVIQARYNAFAKPIAYVIQDRSHLLVLAHGVDDAPDRRRCTAATATTHGGATDGRFCHSVLSVCLPVRPGAARSRLHSRHCSALRTNHRPARPRHREPCREGSQHHDPMRLRISRSASHEPVLVRAPVRPPRPATGVQPALPLASLRHTLRMRGHTHTGANN